MFEKLLELVTKCAVEYKFKAAQSQLTDEARARYSGYASDFELLRKEIRRLEPVKIAFKDWQFQCPKCGGDLDRVCDAAEETGMRLEWCPWCGQGIDAYVKVEM